MLKEAKQKHVTILNVHISTQSRYPVLNQGESIGEIIAGCFRGSVEGGPRNFETKLRIHKYMTQVPYKVYKSRGD